MTTCGLAIASAKKPPVVANASPAADIDPDAPPPVSRVLPFRAACHSDAECATGTCVDFRDRGSFCSQSCVGTGDCPAGSTCNRKHYCK